MNAAARAMQAVQAAGGSYVDAMRAAEHNDELWFAINDLRIDATRLGWMTDAEIAKAIEATRKLIVGYELNAERAVKRGHAGGLWAEEIAQAQRELARLEAEARSRA